MNIGIGNDDENLIIHRLNLFHQDELIRIDFAKMLCSSLKLLSSSGNHSQNLRKHQRHICI